MVRRLPAITRNSMANDAIWLALFITLLAALGWIGLANLSLGIAVLGSDIFLLALIVVAILNIVYAKLTTDRLSIVQEILGAFFVAIGLPFLLGIIGMTAIGGWSLGLIAVFIGAALLEYIGFWLGKSIEKAI